MATTTLVYPLTTVASGIPLLVVAAASLGLLTALQHRGDASSPSGCERALNGVHVAYFLVHSMDGAGGETAAARDGTPLTEARRGETQARTAPCAGTPVRGHAEFVSIDEAMTTIDRARDRLTSSQARLDRSEAAIMRSRNRAVREQDTIDREVATSERPSSEEVNERGAEPSGPEKAGEDDGLAAPDHP